MKIIAQTTGNFGLMDFLGDTSNDLPSGRPAVIEKTSFYGQRIGLEQVKVLCEDVPGDYTDEKLVKDLAAGKSIAQITAAFKKASKE